MWDNDPNEDVGWVTFSIFIAVLIIITLWLIAYIRGYTTVL